MPFAFLQKPQQRSGLDPSLTSVFCSWPPQCSSQLLCMAHSNLSLGPVWRINFLSHLHLWPHDLTRHAWHERSYNIGRLSLYFPVLLRLFHTSRPDFQLHRARGTRGERRGVLLYLFHLSKSHCLPFNAFFHCQREKTLYTNQIKCTVSSPFPSHTPLCLSISDE